MRKIERQAPKPKPEPKYTLLPMARAVYATKTGGLVITGRPPIVDGLPEEEQHNCDAMGCGREHVLLRVPAGVVSLSDLRLLIRG